MLLPGADVDQAAVVAEQLRETVDEPVSGGRRVTMSFGVAASGFGEAFSYKAVFARADAALYEAKGGRRPKPRPHRANRADAHRRLDRKLRHNLRY